MTSWELVSFETLMVKAPTSSAVVRVDTDQVASALVLQYQEEHT